MNWYVYMLLLKNSNYYTGITNNIVKRLHIHSIGKGSKYVRSNRPFELVYLELATNRSEASKREYVIKQLTKNNKLKLITSKINIIKSGGNKYHE